MEEIGEESWTAVRSWNNPAPRETPSRSARPAPTPLTRGPMSVVMQIVLPVVPQTERRREIVGHLDVVLHEEPENLLEKRLVTVALPRSRASWTISRSGPRGRSRSRMNTSRGSRPWFRSREARSRSNPRGPSPGRLRRVHVSRRLNPDLVPSGAQLRRLEDGSRHLDGRACRHPTGDRQTS
jgi:hypothetical protein